MCLASDPLTFVYYHAMMVVLLGDRIASIPIGFSVSELSFIKATIFKVLNTMVIFSIFQHIAVRYLCYATSINYVVLNFECFDTVWVLALEMTIQKLSFIFVAIFFVQLVVEPIHKLLSTATEVTVLH